MNNQWRNNANCMVVWADGTYDTRRGCDVCDLATCGHPVHGDRYREIGTTNLEEMEQDDRATSYWNWMHMNQPNGGFRDNDGDLVTPETSFANPDGLPEVPARNSGIAEEQHEWMAEAYEGLSKEQKEAWDLVMREQLSETEAAKRLQITQQAVEKRLRNAKAAITEYLRSKQNGA